MTKMFRNIVFAACLAGVLAGLVITGLQLFVTVPIILKAETYEPGGHTHGAEHAHGSGGHAHAEQPAASESVTGSGGVFSGLYRSLYAFQHAESDWGPKNSWQRNGSTLVANILLAIAFGLLLVAAFSLRSNPRWAEGLLWGLGGYATFFALPALGLPPEIPGNFTADLVSRQGWWLMTVLFSGVGLALIALQRPWMWKILGTLLVVAPHVLGAPQPEVHGGTAPEALAETFIWRAAFVNLVFWLLLGGLGAWAFLKLAGPKVR